MDKSQISLEKKLTLLILCWLLGLIGVHRFYTRKYFTGGIQLLFLGLAGALAFFDVGINHPLAIPIIAIILLWWIIDAVLIIMGKFTDKEGRPIIDWV